MTEPLIIRIADIRRATHCVRGARRWFAAHGMDFHKFLKDGMAADELLRRSRNDALAMDVVERTRDRMRDDG